MIAHGLSSYFRPVHNHPLFPQIPVDNVGRGEYSENVELSPPQIKPSTIIYPPVEDNVL